ncbi:carboxypeptidase M32 [Oscillibacter sp. MSJ-2]|uniref:Metal-dependent carboxypeptidase n=1 Tax=Dysosmobacter acutus TaxID=2841504 RepID=A0ABS6FCG0_9FIRM|nr:carboxypeptidase M32 [Dysosmobacter acutus]MBU5627962.1 carboxypeptidase M32 [Dysosmobacter acutus]
MTMTQAVERLYRIQRELQAYRNVRGLLYHDASTAAPGKSAASRGQTLAVMEQASARILCSGECRELLAYLTPRAEELPRRERRMVQLMDRERRWRDAVPEEEYLSFQKLLAVSFEIWAHAKEADDFSMLEPFLEQVFAACRRISAWAAPDRPPLDVWLDRYEAGLTVERCDRFFDVLRTGLVPLLKRISAAEPEGPEAEYPLEAQRLLSHRIMDLMGIDRNHCALSESAHPGTTGLTKYDVRITTRYQKNQFAPGLFMVMHEGGHALYELHTADEDAFTCLGAFASMAVHESQSRFYENLVGHSRPFLTFLAPVLQEYFPQQLGGMDEEQIYRSVNCVRKTPIRMEADELTYPLHIMIRHEIEKRIFSGELRVKELPQAWNDLYREYLGVEVRSDREGVLQDCHWAYGSIGYFPSYALGNAYGAQLMQAMKREIDVDRCLREGDLVPVNGWLEEKIWRHGARYEPEQLLESAWGGTFDPGVYLRYLEQKYLNLSCAQ